MKNTSQGFLPFLYGKARLLGFAQNVYNNYNVKAAPHPHTNSVKQWQLKCQLLIGLIKCILYYVSHSQGLSSADVTIFVIFKSSKYNNSMEEHIYAAPLFIFKNLSPLPKVENLRPPYYKKN